MASSAAPRPASIAAPFAALVVGALAMGISPIFVRLADVGPFTSAFWRVALALPALYAWMRLSERGAGAARRRAFRARRFWPGSPSPAICSSGILSIVTTSIANATFFATTAPIWVVLFGWLLFRAARLRGGAGRPWPCAFSAAARCSRRAFRCRAGGALGDIYGLVTGVFFGLYFLAVQAARRGSSAARVTFEATIDHRRLAAGGRAGPGAPIAAANAARASRRCSALAWISHAGGQGLLAVALGRLPAAFSSLVIFLEAIAAACFAWVFLGEPVTLGPGGGGLAILAGIYVARPR